MQCIEFDRKICANKRKKISFLTPDFTAKVISAVKDRIIEEIVQEINRNGGKFGLAVDSTTDITSKHQTSIVVRYIKNNHEISESTVAICDQASSSGKDLFCMIEGALNHVGLNTSNIVAFSFDGAPNMKSDNVGVTHFLHERNPHSIYVWCFAHRFNLVVKTACAASIFINSLLSTVEAVASLFRGSYKRMDVWVNTALSVPNYNSNTKLKLIGKTRWTSKQDAVSNVIKSTLHLFVVIKALVKICNLDGLEGEVLSSACHLLTTFIDY